MISRCATLVAVVLAVVATLTSADDTVTTVDNPVVLVEQGILRGEWVQGSAGTQGCYAAYRGVPYALPPVEELRFKGPRPPSKWEGVRDATEEGSMCPQGSGSNYKGSEDCLYLNVYTPGCGIGVQGAGRAVLVYFHGGGFFQGSGSASGLGPDLLLTQGIIVVTVNYRLGPLGFVNQDTEGMPGNAGLKDALAAVRWVHANIAQFGGDPAKITVAGQSAGGSIAHYLTLVPAASGLIRAAILESGTALSEFAYTEDNLYYASELAARVTAARAGTQYSNTTHLDTSAAVEATLRNASVAEILNAFSQLRKARSAVIGFTSLSPSPERRAYEEGNEEIFLSRDAQSLMLDRAVQPVPTLMGITSNEALTKFNAKEWDLYPEKMDLYNDKLYYLLPTDLWPFRDTATLLKVRLPTELVRDETIRPPFWPREILDIADYVKSTLIGDGNVTQRGQEVLQLTNDAQFTVDVHRTAILKVALEEGNPLYTYLFNFVGDYNLYRATNRVNGTGATHTDELGYLWVQDVLPTQNYFGDSPSSLTMRRLVSMWGNFVNTMDPVPETSELLPIKWTPTSSSELPNQTFLEISDELRLCTAPLGGPHMPFWRNTFTELRNGKSV